MRIKVYFILIVILVFVVPVVLAEDETESPTTDWGVAWTGGMGISYPLLLQVSVAGTVPLMEKAENAPYGLPGVPAARVDLDLGLGGGILSAGVALPTTITKSRRVINVKGALLRTWLWSGGAKVNRTYQGVIAEFVIPSHPSGKIGLGYFRDPHLFTKRDHDLFYVFLGIGL